MSWLRSFIRAHIIDTDPWPEPSRLDRMDQP